MIQLISADRFMANTDRVIRHFPFRIGRSRVNDCQIERTGVWEQHAVVELEQGRPILAGGSGGTILVNGERIIRHVLKNGDLVELGSVRWFVSLTPAKQKAAAVPQAAFWLLMFALFAVQVFAVYRLTDQ